MAIKLFDYQREMRASVLESFVSLNFVMCQMSTGTGKTHVLASVVIFYSFVLERATEGPALQLFDKLCQTDDHLVAGFDRVGEY